MQSILSLGAGSDQIPLLKAIRAHGFGVVGVDKNYEAAGKDLCDRFYPVSNRDTEAILSLPLSGVCGVMAAASEVPDVLSIIQHRLGLPGISPAAGYICKDKYLYKQILRAAGVPHTQAEITLRGAERWTFDELGYEVVVKPRQGSGSRGVQFNFHSPMSLPLMVMEAETYHPHSIMERYQPGPEISAQVAVFNGECFVLGFVDRFYDPFTMGGKPYVPEPRSPYEGRPKELGGSTPSAWASEIPAAKKVMHDAARALGITRGMLKFDLVLTDAGPVIIELTPRLPGGPFWKLLLEGSGIDLFGVAIKLATGDTPIGSECRPTLNERVAVDMRGNLVGWADSRRWVKLELGKAR